MSNETWNEICGTVLKQLQEINELKAMVNALREFVTELSTEAVIEVTTPTGRFGGDEDHEYIDVEWIEGARGLLEETPKQCLANVKADAVEEFASVLCSPKCGFEYRLSDAAKVYADKLRKTMITTSSESSLSEVVNKINEEL